MAFTFSYVPKAVPTLGDLTDLIAYLTDEHTRISQAFRFAKQGLDALAASDLTNGTTGSGAVVLANTPTLITPVLGVATGTSLAATGLIKSSSASAGVGYATGAGSTVTQLTNKSTGVTINAVCGAITMNNAALNASTSVGFTVTNSAVAATDVVIVNISSGATAASYVVCVDAVAGGSFKVHLRNITAGNLSEAVVLNFAVIKAVAA